MELTIIGDQGNHTKISFLISDAENYSNAIVEKREKVQISDISSENQRTTPHILHDELLLNIPNSVPVLSLRAQQWQRDVGSHLSGLLDFLNNPYTSSNPSGLLNVGISENSLMRSHVADFFEQSFSSNALDLSYGSSLTGSAAFFHACAEFFNRYFKPFTPVLQSHVVAGVGASGVLHHLAGLLCDKDDALMIAKPYYDGYDYGIGGVTAFSVMGIDIPDGIHPASPESVDAFAAHLTQLRAQNSRRLPRGILLCNPHNPLGFCYPRETLIAYAKLCEKENIHLIVDEIFALSTYGDLRNTSSNGDQRPLSSSKDYRNGFTSILSINPWKDAQCNPSRIHTIYGLSKDFGCNGLRIGILVSQSNPQLVDTFARSAMVATSSPSDLLAINLLTNQAFCGNYVIENQQKLLSAYTFISEWLEHHKIPHRDTQAGLFVMIDLRAFLPITIPWLKQRNKSEGPFSDLEQEQALYAMFIEEGRVYLAAGQAYHFEEAGWFRLTFSMPKKVMKIALRRIKTVLGITTDQARHVPRFILD